MCLMSFSIFLSQAASPIRPPLSFHQFFFLLFCSPSCLSPPISYHLLQFLSSPSPPFLSTVPVETVICLFLLSLCFPALLFIPWLPASLSPSLLRHFLLASLQHWLLNVCHHIVTLSFWFPLQLFGFLSFRCHMDGNVIMVKIPQVEIKWSENVVTWWQWPKWSWLPVLLRSNVLKLLSLL